MLRGNQDEAIRLPIQIDALQRNGERHLGDHRGLKTLPQPLQLGIGHTCAGTARIDQRTIRLVVAPSQTDHVDGGRCRDTSSSAPALIYPMMRLQTLMKRKRMKRPKNNSSTFVAILHPRGSKGSKPLVLPFLFTILGHPFRDPIISLTNEPTEDSAERDPWQMGESPRGHPNYQTDDDDGGDQPARHTRVPQLKICGTNHELLALTRFTSYSRGEPLPA